MKTKLWCGVEVSAQNAERLRIIGEAMIEYLNRKHPEWSTLPMRKLPDTFEGNLYCEAVSFALM